MGEIADDMIDGTMCSTCGCIFKDPSKPETKDEQGRIIEHAYSHGYPAVCWDCWKDRENRASGQRAKTPTF